MTDPEPDDDEFLRALLIAICFAAIAAPLIALILKLMYT